jgi:hypothetical protein
VTSWADMLRQANNGASWSFVSELLLEESGLGSSFDIEAVQTHICAEKQLNGEYRCIETPTHYRWNIVRGDDCSIWIHEYKPSRLVFGRYADQVHDHGYSFTGVVLRGGYSNEKFTIECDTEAGKIQTTHYHGAIAVSKDESLSMKRGEIHRVTNIQDGTVTIVVKSRRYRSYSSVYHLDTGMITNVPSAGARMPNLISRLGISDANA